MGQERKDPNNGFLATDFHWEGRGGPDLFAILRSARQRLGAKPVKEAPGSFDAPAPQGRKHFEAGRCLSNWSSETRESSMSMPARLESHLSKHHVVYGRVFHPPIHSTQKTASVMHYPDKEVAKTIALRAGHKTLLAVLPASHHINLERLGTIVGGKVHLLDERKCVEIFADCEPGAIPLFGELYGLPVYMDQALVENPEIVFCAGTLSEGIRMGNVEFMHLVKPGWANSPKSPKRRHRNARG